MVLDELGKFTDFILIQEHWLFDCNLHKLKEISSSYTGTGKHVDTGNQILPVQMPRGYGGAAVLWKPEIDHSVQPLPDGGNRTQCVQVKDGTPLLLKSVYMPCRGLSDNVKDYVDCLDQLYEIVEKYSSSHIVILGGDMNEDLVLREQTARANHLKKFLAEAEMDTKSTTQTFVNPDGVFASTLDYVFYLKKFSGTIVGIRTLENLLTNVSDHVPVLCKIEFSVDRVKKDENSRI